MQNLTKMQKLILAITLLWFLFIFTITAGENKQALTIFIFSLPFIVYWVGVWIFGFGYIVKIFKAPFKQLTSRKRNKIKSTNNQPLTIFYMGGMIVLIMGLIFLALNIKQWFYNLNEETSHRQDAVQEFQKMNADYDEKQPLANKPKSPIAISLEQMDTQEQAMLNKARLLASQITPEEEAQIKALAEKNNISFELAKENIIRLKTDEIFAKMKEAKQKAPYLANLLGGSTYASMSQEDIDNLTLDGFDKFMKRLNNALFGK